MFFSTILIIVLAGFDQLIKNILIYNVYIIELLNINHNTGFAFSLFPDSNISTGANFIAILFILLYWILKRRSYVEYWLILIIAGGLSNVIDRIRFSSVIDYINLFNISVINIADIYITIGTAIFLYQYLNKKLT